MARKRQLDPDFFSDEEMAILPYEGRLFYAGTWCHCEDTGVFEVKHKTLKAQIFPHDTIDTEPLYNQIKDKGKYIEYQCNGLLYAFIKGFHKRQKIQWPSISRLPLPPEPYLSLIPEKIKRLNESSMSPHSVLNEPSQRIELNRIEKNREKKQPYWAAFKETTQEELKKVSKAFNIYQFMGRLKKMKGVEIPEEVISKICTSWRKNGAGVRKHWAWFITATQGQWEAYNAEQQIKEGQTWKKEPVAPAIVQILKEMKL